MSSLDLNYTAPPTVSKFMRSDAFHKVMAGPVGCVSADTEFLTPAGWKRIDQFAHGDLVGQWHENGKMEFVEPLAFIDEPCEELIWFRNSSLSMRLSDEHRVPVYDWSGAFKVKPASRLAEKPSKHILPINFTPPHADRDITDNMLRLAVAINADAHHAPVGVKTTFGVRKDRKKARIRMLLDANGIPFKERCYPSRPTEVSFDFVSEYKGKTYTGEAWWGLSKRQLQIVVEEMSYWDGLFEGEDTRYYSAHKIDADFMQYAVHAIGGKASISKVEYPQENWNATYIVHIALPGSIKAVATLQVDSVVIDRTPTDDGRKYCFTAPTGFFVARHNGFIFVTGNSGKSAGCCIEIMRRCLEMPPWDNGIRRSKWAIIRNTMKELRTTTLETWMEWMGDFGIWYESKFMFHLKFADVDAKILFLPLDGPGDIGRVLSLELTGAWTNEGREIPVSLLSDIKGRIGRYPAHKNQPEGITKFYEDHEGNEILWFWAGLLCDTNPPEEDSDWHKLMEHMPQVENDQGSIIDCEVYKQPSGVSEEAENVENLRPGYYQNLMKNNPTAWVDVYVHGKYAISQAGKPVYATSFKRDKHVSPVPLDIHPTLPVIIGYDTGLSPALSFSQLVDGRVRVLREVAAFDMGMKRCIQEYVRPMVRNEFPDNALIFYGDVAAVRRGDGDESSAQKELKAAFCEDDRNIFKTAYTNNPDVRIQALEQLLVQFPMGEPMMLIDPSCKRTIRGLQSMYRFQRVRATGGYADRPQKTGEPGTYSHLIDGLQYSSLYILGGKYNAADFMRRQNRDPMGFWPRRQMGYQPVQEAGY